MKNTKASSSTALPRAEALRNPILNIDSYKLSHYLQYPPAARAVSAYVEARSGEDMDHGLFFFWLQMFVLNCVSRPVTASGIDEAEDLATAHGLPPRRNRPRPRSGSAR